MRKPPKFIYGDCLEKMPGIESGSLDAIVCDPPYGTTVCKWDAVIPLEPMWKQLRRVIKPNGAIILTATYSFGAALFMSNPAMYKYDLVWEKTAATGFLNAKKMPMRCHESILIFYSKPPTYNPIKTKGHGRKKALRRGAKMGEIYGKHEIGTEYNSTERYPRSVLRFKKDKQSSSLHPTQKPVALMEYLIKTYTNEGDTVLDFAMGSGTTGVACANTNRAFVGIELKPRYFDIAKKRIEEANNTLF